ncbi:MAG TPA: hypothetical protein VK824_08750, partial [Planctomycetota bacterium]|nr:hypothetical protein [Planctomycetota bacterium]
MLTALASAQAASAQATSAQAAPAQAVSAQAASAQATSAAPAQAAAGQDRASSETPVRGGDIVLVGGQLFDGRGGPAQPLGMLLIRAGRIAEILSPDAPGLA